MGPVDVLLTYATVIVLALLLSVPMLGLVEAARFFRRAMASAPLPFPTPTSNEARP